MGSGSGSGFKVTVLRLGLGYSFKDDTWKVTFDEFALVNFRFERLERVQGADSGLRFRVIFKVSLGFKV